MLLDRIGYYARHTCRLDKQGPILVGVSGGPDSLCLLDGLHRLGYSVVAAHFNHQLRPDAELDAAYVRSFCQAEGIPIVLDSQPVADFARTARLSLEDAARTFRYQFLFTQANLYRARAVAVGHTADDQVETIFLHLLQGAGLTGLRGMSPRSINHGWDTLIPLVRPLLGIGHVETMAYCLERGLQPSQDPTNLDTRYLRNRLRHEVIPILETCSPQFKEAILRLSSLVEADDEHLVDETGQALQECLQVSTKEYLILKRSSFTSLSLALRRRVLRSALAGLVRDRREIGWEVVERSLVFIDQPGHSHPIDLVGGLCLRIERDSIILAGWKTGLPSDDFPQINVGANLILAVPGKVELGGGWSLEAAWIEEGLQGAWEQALDNPDPYQAWLDGSTVEVPLEGRGRRAGDRFQPLGLAGQTQKLSDFFVNARLPARLRLEWPLVCSSNRIIWIPGFRQSHETRLTDHTRSILHLHCYKY